jgi:hypothetical protein
MQRIDLLDFSGGISEQYSIDGFTNRQWSKIKGFILDSDYTLRSQWPLQSIGELGINVKAISGFTGSSNTYLVAIDTSGYVWTATAPSNTANYTTTNAVSWTKQTTISANTDYRLVCEVLLPIEGLGNVNALLVNCIGGSTNAYMIYEDDTTNTIAIKTYNVRKVIDQPNLIDPMLGETKSAANALSFTATTTLTSLTTFTATTAKWTIANDGNTTITVYLNSTLVTYLSPFDSYTHSVALGSGDVVKVQTITGTSIGRLGIAVGSYPLPKRNVIPKANVGVMWRNRLVLGDIERRIDSKGAWETANLQRNPYAFFYSEAFPDQFHEQAILYAGSGESQIVGMHVLDDYLITIASCPLKSDGLRLFKGTLDYVSLQNGTQTVQVNLLRGGVGPARNVDADGHRIASTVWSEAGIVVFLDHLGGVWYTDGVEVDRLDRTGPANPDLTNEFDEVCAVGKYLFVRRQGRLLVLNILSGIKGQTATAAWTELVLPSGQMVSSMACINGNLYCVMNNDVYRFAMSRNNNADTERAAVNNTQLTLTVATATVGDPDQHSKVNWSRFGFRSRGKTNTAKVVDVKVIAGPALDATKPSYTKTLDRVLDERDELVIPAGIGVATEASGEVTFKGDIQLESATFYANGARISRPAGGSDA